MSETILLGPGEGRTYAMGKLRAVFKADEGETDARYSISEWIAEPGFAGVGAHVHSGNDEVFVVMAGNPSILVGEEWHRLDPGAFLRIPAGVLHDFRNDGDAPATLLNLFIPGGFERNMPSIVDWFARNG